jgi:Tfp pilus assembly protein PilN
MAQQINLYSPILLTPKRHFSALAMLQALAALGLGLGALSLWVSQSTERVRAELASATQVNANDSQRLQAALASRPARPTDTAALEQELAAARKALAEQRGLLRQVSAADPSHSRAALLRLLALTAPESLWLTEVRLADGQLQLAGLMLQPEALRPWIASLSASPALAGLEVRSLKVERSDAVSAVREVWSFRFVAGYRSGEAADAAPGAVGVASMTGDGPGRREGS